MKKNLPSASEEYVFFYSFLSVAALTLVIFLSSRLSLFLTHTEWMDTAHCFLNMASACTQITPAALRITLYAFYSGTVTPEHLY